MKLTVLSVLFAIACAAFGGELIVGKWACRSNDGAGTTLAWTLVVKEDGGKLSGSIAGDMGEIPLIDPKLDGNVFTFKFRVNENCTLDTKLKIDGRKFEGSFACPQASGTMAGIRQP